MQAIASPVSRRGYPRWWMWFLLIRCECVVCGLKFQDQPREIAVYEKNEISQCVIVTLVVLACTSRAVPAAKTQPPSVSKESEILTLSTALGLFPGR